MFTMLPFRRGSRLLQALVLSLVLTSFTSKAEIVDLTVDEFYEYVTTGEALIIDVRTTISWFSGHIENATYFRNFVPFLQVTPADQINATLQRIGIFPCLLHCTTIGKCLLFVLLLTF